MDHVLEAVINSFINSPFLIEVKYYFLSQTIHYLSYEHIDRVLTSVEERFQEVEEDGSNSYLLTNLNPVKTAVHMLMLLSQIEERYSVTGKRTDNLSEIINGQAESVLTKLFFPR